MIFSTKYVCRFVPLHPLAPRSVFFDSGEIVFPIFLDSREMMVSTVLIKKAYVLCQPLYRCGYVHPYGIV